MRASDANATLIQILNGILAQWTAPDFTTAVAAREGVLLDPGALTLLSILNNSGAQRPSALAENMVTGASNISKIIARLKDAGLVQRTGDPRDSRASLIGLTEAGERAGAAIRQSGSTLVDELLGDWTETDRSDLVRLLGRFEVESHRVAGSLRASGGEKGSPGSGPALGS